VYAVQRYGPIVCGVREQIPPTTCETNVVIVTCKVLLVRVDKDFIAAAASAVSGSVGLIATPMIVVSVSIRWNIGSVLRASASAIAPAETMTNVLSRLLSLNIAYARFTALVRYRVVTDPV